MKRLISMVMVLVLCCSLMTPYAFSSEVAVVDTVETPTAEDVDETLTETEKEIEPAVYDSVEVINEPTVETVDSETVPGVGPVSMCEEENSVESIENNAIEEVFNEFADGSDLNEDSGKLNIDSVAIVASGICGDDGDNIVWSLDEIGLLSISGSGKMKDWETRSPWYDNREDIKSVVISAGISTIGRYAFYNCSNLKSVVIPEGITSIGSHAFNNCSNLISVELPDSVTEIGSFEFQGCSNLVSLVIPDGVESIEAYTFSDCGFANLVIPDSVTSIDEYACAGCSNLKTVEIGEGVKTIGGYAFGWCNSLTSIYIPESVVGLAGSAFQSCTSLKEITVSPLNTKFTSKDNVLFSRDMKTLIRYPLGKQESMYTIPAGITVIDMDAFCGCANLQQVVIPNSVESIGYYAFLNCTNLFSVVIPGSVSWIGKQAFDGCSSLCSVTIDEGVADIYFAAFSDCTSLMCIKIPSSVEEIHEQAFQNCSNLTCVMVCSELTEIGAYAFSQCNKLRDVYFTGTEENWKNVRIYDGNSCFTDANIHYNSTGPYSITVSAGKPVDGEVSFQYHSSPSYNDTMVTESFTFRDSFFSGSSTTYNHELAIASLCTTMTATSSCGKSDKYVREILLNIGCDDGTIYTNRFDVTDSTDDNCAYAFGLKKLPDSDYYLLPVFIRSNGYGGEWVSNVHVIESGYENYAAGFKMAADEAYEALINKYIPALEAQGVSREKVKIWVTGFSRGGAIANLLTVRLNEESGIPLAQIYGYTFATPTTVLYGSDQKYTNLYNIISQIDAVPRVPLTTWYYTHHGQDLYLPCWTKNGTKYAGRLVAMQSEFSEIMDNAGLTEENVPIEGQELVLDLLVDFLDDIIINRESYEADGFQSVMMGAMEKSFADGTKANLVKELVWMLFAGDEETKNYVYDLLDGEITVDRTVAVCLKNLMKKFNISADTVLSIPGYRVLTVLVDFFLRYGIHSSMLDSCTDYYDKFLYMLDDLCDNGFSSALLKQHWPESYLAWMRSGTENELFSTTSYRKMSVKCPVDICVYDSNDVLVAKITDDVVDDSLEASLCAYVNEYGEKVVYLPDDDDYRIEVVAREDGEVSIVEKEYDAENELTESECYLNLPMEENQKFTVLAEEEITVTTDGKTLEPDAGGTGELSKITVTAIGNDYGTVNGAGEYSLGETVALMAEPSEDGHFTGWYIDEQLVESAEILSFVASDDENVEALFCLIGDINGDETVNLLDAVKLLKKLMNENTEVTYADVNDDGDTNVKDVLHLVKMLVGAE